MGAQLNSEDLALYARHFSLPGFTHETQAKLKSARVLVVGVGGLGCPALIYLIGAGIGNIGIVDGDTVSMSNLHRQTLFELRDVGQPKAFIAAQRLSQKMPNTSITPYDSFLSEANAAEICDGYDVVVDGADNFATKYLLDEICEGLRVPLVYASIFQFEGQLSVFHWQADPDGPKSYRDLYPSPPPPNAVGNCNEVGVIGTLPGTLGVMQANEVVKIVTGIGPPMSSQLLTYDALTCHSNILRFKRRVTVLANGQTPAIAACGTGDEAEVNAKEVLEWIMRGKSVSLVDVRSHAEHGQRSIGGSCIPLPTLPEAMTALPTDGALVFYCHSGLRSHKAHEYMVSIGRSNVFSLRGGMSNIDDSDVDALGAMNDD